MRTLLADATFALASFDPACKVWRMGKATHYDLHQSTGFWLHRLYTAMRRQFAVAVADYEITPEHWQVMAGLYQKGARTPQDLADYTGADASTITRRVDQLEKRGLLRRIPNPEDRRSIHLELTTEGKQLTPRIARVAKELNELAMIGMSAAERSAFQAILRRMIRNLGEPLPACFVDPNDPGRR